MSSRTPPRTAPLRCLRRLAELRACLAEWRRRELRVALAPTMGNLHRGHLALLRRAQREAERALVTIFVNPIQFGPGEDYAQYPRTPERDLELLREHGADAVFLPQAEELFPRGTQGHTQVRAPELDGILCGASRPGHFAGVATIVAKLFGLTRPDVAVFGLKDYQQLLVIRRIAADLALGARIVAEPTVREADGLALSSRNAYLSPPERAAAPGLYRTLERLAGRVRDGAQGLRALEERAREELAAAGFRPEYVSVRDARTLAPPADPAPARGPQRLVALAAARLGKARLIDCLPFERRAAPPDGSP